MRIDEGGKVRYRQGDDFARSIPPCKHSIYIYIEYKLCSYVYCTNNTWVVRIYNSTAIIIYGRPPHSSEISAITCAEDVRRGFTQLDAKQTRGNTRVGRVQLLLCALHYIDIQIYVYTETHRDDSSTVIVSNVRSVCAYMNAQCAAPTDHTIIKRTY